MKKIETKIYDECVSDIKNKNEYILFEPDYSKIGPELGKYVKFRITKKTRKGKILRPIVNIFSKTGRKELVSLFIGNSNDEIKQYLNLSFIQKIIVKYKIKKDLMKHMKLLLKKEIESNYKRYINMDVSKIDIDQNISLLK